MFIDKFFEIVSKGVEFLEIKIGSKQATYTGSSSVFVASQLNFAWSTSTWLSSIDVTGRKFVTCRFASLTPVNTTANAENVLDITREDRDIVSQDLAGVVASLNKVIFL